jgi:hypothetical protein
MVAERLDMSGKMERAKLREAFDQVLEQIWKHWENWELKGMPWGAPDELIEETSLDSWEMIKFYTDVGWAQGMNQAFGWPLDRPYGPREWSPRKK